MRVRPVGLRCSIWTQERTDRHDEIYCRFRYFFEKASRKPEEIKGGRTGDILFYAIYFTFLIIISILLHSLFDYLYFTLHFIKESMIGRM